MNRLNMQIRDPSLWHLSGCFLQELLTYLFAKHPTVSLAWWETPPKAKALTLLQECSDPSSGFPLIKEVLFQVAASLPEK